MTSFLQTSSSNEPPDAATAQAVANAFLQSVGDSMNNHDDEDGDTHESDDQVSIL